MSEEQKTLQFKNITIEGPSQHPGEKRYHWFSENTENPTMMVRVEKLPGHGKEYDQFSPIVQLCWIRDVLSVRVVPPDRVPGFVGHSAGIFNCYLNRSQLGPPSFMIPEASLGMLHYRISSLTNFRGDFLIIGSTKANRPRQMIVINLSALGLFDGLTHITMDGEFIFYEHSVGTLSYTTLKKEQPIFEDLLLDHDDRYGYRALQESAARLHRRAMALLEKSVNGTHMPSVTGFDQIACDVDRSGSFVDGAARGKKLLTELFPN